MATNGDHGTFSTTYGMGADNLLEAIIMTPNGSVLLTNPRKNWDIFYAIRGRRGGTFGVVLKALSRHIPLREDQTVPFQVCLLSNITTTPNYIDGWGIGSANEDVATGGLALGSRLPSPKSLSNPNVTAEVFQQIDPDPLGNNGVYTNPSILGHTITSPNAPSYHVEVISTTPTWRDALTHLIVVERWRDDIAQPLIDAVYDDITHKKIQPLRELSPEQEHTSTNAIATNYNDRRRSGQRTTIY
ncbi:hypothetical protein EJ04DRAFT_563025 [Polyplosphaeria fusca]|uniref:FAD-binding PCMH-type domain-containing protein n=1 Tax=Polyplosphaeria fusca TaxID=682080 RepID=A0A9P4V123_9PLEO|nr:hypothetical protein EJ04DRAFT_563025 [Polyplosphaeria fusca]